MLEIVNLFNAATQGLANVIIIVAGLVWLRHHARVEASRKFQLRALVGPGLAQKAYVPKPMP